MSPTILVVESVAGSRLGGSNFSLPRAVRDLEARLIEQALDEAGGSVTRAAKLLGMGRQTLPNVLKGRHKGLAGKRTPPRRRLKSIIKKSGRRGKKRGGAS